MAINYSLVAFNTTVLTEAYVGNPGSFTTIARRILPRIQATEAHKKSYAYEGHLYHYIADEKGLICMCRANEDMQHKLCFEFLNEIRTKFLGTYEEEFHLGTENSFDSRFNRTLKDRMAFYSHNPSADAISHINNQVDQVTNKMKENIGVMLERGAQIETLVEKTGDIQATGVKFRKNAVKVKHKVWWKNMKYWVALLIVIVICVIIIIGVSVIAAKGLIPFL